MKPPLIDIRPDHWAIVRDILRKHVPRHEVWAFGSRAKWTAKEYSDLDLAVIGDEPLPLAVSAALADELSESDLPWKVDVVDWATTKPEFRKIIERGKVVVKKVMKRQLETTDWRATTFGECADFLSGGTPSKANPEYWNGDIPWLSAKDMKTFRICDTEDHVTELGAKNGTKLVPAETIFLLTRGMTLLNDVPVCVAQKSMTFNQDVKALRARPGIRDDFLAYLILSLKPKMQDMVDLAGHGTGKLNTDELKAIALRVPENEDDQRAIAYILGTLDDKIELNRRMNETLETIARAIFQSWFVDFDPVRAKMSGEAPDSICRRLGLTPDLLALFPDRLIHSELGEIPEGWSPQRLDHLLELVYGKALKASDRVDGSIPVYGSGGLTGFHNEHLVQGPGIIVGRKGTIGSLYWVDGPFYAIDTVFYVVSNVELTYCFYLLKTLDLNKMNTDAAVPGLNRNNVYRLLIACPNSNLTYEFDRIIKPIHDYMFALKNESELLHATRNELLPNLLSGKQRVPYEGVA